MPIDLRARGHEDRCCDNCPRGPVNTALDSLDQTTINSRERTDLGVRKRVDSDGCIEHERAPRGRSAVKLNPVPISGRYRRGHGPAPARDEVEVSNSTSPGRGGEGRRWGPKRVIL